MTCCATIRLTRRPTTRRRPSGQQARVYGRQAGSDHCIKYIRGVSGRVARQTDRIGHFYGNSKPRLHLPLNFALLDSEWRAISLQATIDAYFNALQQGAWPAFVIGGHDKHRVARKVRQAQAQFLRCC